MTKSNWEYFNTKDQEEILAAQEDCSFHFQGATKAVDTNDANVAEYNRVSSPTTEESIHNGNEKLEKLENMVSFDFIQSAD